MSDKIKILELLQTANSALYDADQVLSKVRTSKENALNLRQVLISLEIAERALTTVLDDNWWR